MIWTDVKGFDGKYRINDFGIVKNAETNQIVKSNKTNSSLIRVGLYKDGKTHQLPLHKLVYRHFINEEIPEGWYVKHSDGNTNNNRVSNLYLQKGKDKPSGRRYPTEIKKEILKKIEEGMDDKTIIQLYSISQNHLTLVRRGYWDKYKD